MAILRFGKSCDACHVVHNDYSVEDIAYCYDCERDLCDACATDHVIVREWDEESVRTRSCDPHPVQANLSFK